MIHAYTIEIEVDAPIETVWEVLTDARSWSDWSRIGSSTLEREGTPAPDGVGALRRFKTGPISSREEVTRHEPPADGVGRFGYRLVSGLPVTGYEADVRLSTRAEATTVHWSGSFDRAAFGTRRLMVALLRKAVGDISGGLKAEAERRASA